MVSTTKALQERVGKVISSARERLAQITRGPHYTAIDMSDERVDRVYRYGLSSGTRTQLLNPESMQDYTTYNNTFDRSQYQNLPHSTDNRSYVPNSENPNSTSSEMQPFSNTTANHRTNEGRTAVDSGSNDLTTTITVIDELARIVWDLSAAAEMHPAQTTNNDLSLLQQMATDAIELQKQLQEQLSQYSGNDERIFQSALESNDAIQNVLSSYDNIMLRVVSAREESLNTPNDSRGGVLQSPTSIDPTTMTEQEIIDRLSSPPQQRLPQADLPDLIRLESLDTPMSDISALNSPPSGSVPLLEGHDERSKNIPWTLPPPNNASSDTTSTSSSLHQIAPQSTMQHNPSSNFPSLL